MIENTPELWRDKLPQKEPHGHKYDSGHALIYGAPELTGATRLAATACARIGAGLVTVLANKDIANVYRASLPACILVRDDLNFMDEKITAKIFGPGGLPIKPDFKGDLPTVLDADALYDLPQKLSPNYVLTPHAGEFARAFTDIKGSRIECAQAAAEQIQAHIVLKGAETIIAAPGGDVVINKNASPYLATAGTGDVLAGMIGGLLAQKMDPLHAACAAVWLHGECAKQAGKGLIADDLVIKIPSIMKMSL